MIARTLVELSLLASIVSNGMRDRALDIGPGCATPPYQEPVFEPPPDDSVVFESLLEAAGYGTNNTWVDVAAGNFCGGAEKELVLVQNASPYFSILRAPTPFLRGTGDLNSSSAHPWRAVAAGDFDSDPHDDEIVAVREVSLTGVPDLVIANVDSDCNLTVHATKAIGTAGNSSWVDVAVGDFRGVGDEIVMVKNTPAYFVAVAYIGVWDVYFTGSLGSRSQYPWKALAAGNLNGTAGDELIAARKVTDGAGSTVRTYSWNDPSSSFWLQGYSLFANAGNHTWISAAAGNFGGDAREAIVLVKNKHSNFVVFDYPYSNDPPLYEVELNLVESSDLQTVPEAPWVGLAATDWLDEDQGYEELVALRNQPYLIDEDTPQYQTDVLVYGNPFHRVRHETGLAGTKSVVAGNEYELAPGLYGFLDVEEIKGYLSDLHANTYDVMLRLPGEYDFFVQFLEATRNFCVDGQQLRVWVSLVGPSHIEPKGEFCSQPSDSALTSWDELAYFTTSDDCTDFTGWFSMLSQLAQDYPHLVAVGIDDYLSVHNTPTFTPEYVAELQSRMQWPSEWLSFVPTVYYEQFYVYSGGEFHGQLLDLPLSVDSLAFYFTNNKEGQITGIGPSCGDGTWLNAIEEWTDMAALLPPDRKLHAGVYFSRSFCAGNPPNPNNPPSKIYTYEMLNRALAEPSIGGTTVYAGHTLWADPNQLPPIPCTDPLDHKYCVVQDGYARGDLFSDGFELGDTSAWSATVP